MKLQLLPLLACPDCGGSLEYAALPEHPREGEEIEKGALRCRTCAKGYPIVDSIPRLYPGAEQDAKVRRTRKSFGWEWSRYPGSRAEDKDLLLAETQIPEEDWDGRLVLDAGCGMGRYASVALSLGAEVVAFDLSDSILRLIPEARANPRLHLVQGDLLRPPFKKDGFDTVYSQGVIHHTADTHAAFRNIAALVKRDGLLSVWVYGTPGSYASFSTNPLRTTRRWIKRVLPLVWLIVWARQLFSDALRVFTTRMPVWMLYALCYPLTALGAVPLLKYLTFSVERDFRVRLIENFDWLSPPYQTKHTKEEMRVWYEDAGAEVLRALPHGMVPKVGLLGRKTRKG